MQMLYLENTVWIISVVCLSSDTLGISQTLWPPPDRWGVESKNGNPQNIAFRKCLFLSTNLVSCQFFG